MKNFFSKVVGFFQWLWKRPEVQEALTALQQKAWEDLKAIAAQAIAEVKAGNFTNDEEKRKAAFNRIKSYAILRGKTYPDSIINWIIEHAYQRFQPTVI